MIAKTSNAVTLLKCEKKSFKGREGKQVEYVSARLLDDTGNVYDCSVDKEVHEKLVGQSSVVGQAFLDIFEVGQGAGKRTKIRLMDFFPSK